MYHSDDDPLFDMDLEEHYQLAVKESDEYFRNEELKRIMDTSNRYIQQRKQRNEQARREWNRPHRRFGRWLQDLLSLVFKPLLIPLGWWSHKGPSIKWRLTTLDVWWYFFWREALIWTIIGAVGLVALFVLITWICVPLNIFFPGLIDWIFDLIFGPPDPGIAKF